MGNESERGSRNLFVLRFIPHESGKKTLIWTWSFYFTYVYFWQAQAIYSIDFGCILVNGHTQGKKRRNKTSAIASRAIQKADPTIRRYAS